MRLLKQILPDDRHHGQMQADRAAGKHVGQESGGDELSDECKEGGSGRVFSPAKIPPPIQVLIVSHQPSVVSPGG